MEEKNISVIIPVYNAQDTIKRAADSVLSSKREDIELILVVDGATDNSLEICNQIKENDNRVKVIYQENKGTLCARLEGINNATGRYLIFLDSDDEYLDGIFERMIELINKYQPDLIKFRYKKDKYDQYKYFEEDEILINKNDFPNKVYPMFIDGFQLNAIWNLCVKRERLNNIKFNAKNIKYGEDLMMNLEIFNNINSALFINDIFYKYNTNSNSVTQSRDRNKWLKNLQDVVDVYMSLFYYIKIWHMDTIDNIMKVEKRVKKEISVVIELLK